MALGSSELVGAIGPNQHLKVSLGDSPSNTIARAHGVGSYSVTVFHSEFAYDDGEPYRLQGGEWLKAPALGAKSSWRVPDINTRTDLAADKVAATCFPNGRFVVLAEDPRGFGSGLDYGTAGPSGDFEVDLTSQVNVRKGSRVAVLCYSPEGDEITQESTAR